jgi:arylsulfatase A-like enzyme
MTKLPSLAFLTALLLAPLVALHAADAPVKKPSIVVILADDMGYSDPGCFGGEIATPAIDRLAQEGIRLTHFQNRGICIVSRLSLMTGQWWPQARATFARTLLLPERLQQAGYRTALIGKWHLSGNPMQRGFDHFFGFLGGFADHFTGSFDYRLDNAPFKDFGDHYYSSDQFTDRAIQFIQADSPKPFFLYLSFRAPHNPLQAPREDIMKYRGKYRAGWQAVREARFKRQKELGIVSGCNGGGAKAGKTIINPKLPATVSITGPRAIAAREIATYRVPCLRDFRNDIASREQNSRRVLDG